MPQINLHSQIIYSLILFLFLIMGSALAITYGIQRQQVWDDTQQKNIALSQLTQDQLDVFYSKLPDILTPVTDSKVLQIYLDPSKKRFLFFQTGVKEAIEEIFLKINQTSSDLIFSIRLVDSQGMEKIVVQESLVQKNLQNIQHEKYFQQMIQEASFQRTHAFFRIIEEVGPVLEYGVPVEYSGKKVGILIVSIYMRLLDKLFESFQIEGAVDEVYATDWVGRYLINTRNPEKAMHGTAEEHGKAFMQLMTGETGAVFDKEDDEVMSYSTHKELGIRFMLATTNKTMLKALNTVFQKVIPVLIGGVAIFSILLFFLLNKLQRAEGKLLKNMAMLEESEKKFRSVTQSATDAILSANSQGILTYWNKSAQAIFHYSEEEILGKSLNQIIPERYREGHQAGMRRYIETEDPHIMGKPVEMHGLRKGGIEFPIEIALSSWKIENDISFTAIIRDITERKKAEDELKKSYQVIKSQHNQLELELAHARETQKILFPSKLPSFPNIKLARKYVPMEQIGGDFYDVFSVEDGQLGIMVGDVTGHGIPAALLSFMVSGTFRNNARGWASTQGVIDMTNGFLDGKMPSASFATMFYGIYDHDQKSLLFTNASHPPGLVLRPSTGEVFSLKSHGLPVGVFPSDITNYKEEVFSMQSDDKLLLYTDAIFEIKDEKKKMWGAKQLEEFLKEHQEESIETLLNMIYEFGLSYSHTNSFNDDVTMIGMQILH
ncbi:MAG: SpoIIE family protein phosphatase [SAR324 cluster bacterium]|nr:SpoIIE family protein phosphatase [SAR324 cluster bacterium]